MSCVWDGLAGGIGIPAHVLYMFIKANNTETDGISVKTSERVSKRSKTEPHVEVTELTDKLREENKARIEEIAHIGRGYYCSTCDPLIILVSYLFQINIVHNYSDKCIVEYINTNGTFPTMIVESNDRHFWCDKSKNKHIPKYCKKLFTHLYN